MALEQFWDSAGPADTGINININMKKRKCLDAENIAMFSIMEKKFSEIFRNSAKKCQKMKK